MRPYALHPFILQGRHRWVLVVGLWQWHRSRAILSLESLVVLVEALKSVHQLFLLI